MRNIKKWSENPVYVPEFETTTCRTQTILLPWDIPLCWETGETINRYTDNQKCYFYKISFQYRLRWSMGSVLVFSTQVLGFKPGQSRRIFRAKKSSACLPSEGKVKPSVSCRRFATCKRSLNLRGSRNLGKITGKISRPQFHLSLLGYLATLRTYRHLAEKVGTSKGGGKQWQTTPTNLPRMQCARAIPVTWLGSGSCQPGL
jgi:hypothetical protein